MSLQRIYFPKSNIIMIPAQIKIIRAATVSDSVDFFRDVMKKMREKGYEMVALSSPGEWLDKVNNEDGFKTIAVPMERHISLVRDLKSLFKLICVFRKEKPNVVHSITPKAGLLCMLAAWMTRVPVRIHTFTGLVWPTATGLQRKILMFTDWITCSCATHVIPEGKGVMNDLQQHITKKPMRVLGYGNIQGVDMERFNPKRLSEVERDENFFTFLYIGRIVGDKGINELVWAFSELKNTYSNIKLRLVGDFEPELDPLAPVTEATICSCGDIEAKDPLYDDELVRAYMMADCFVMPSYREGFPNTVLEAGAMGLPQIVTDINGSREIINNRVNGLIVPSKDKEALFEAMRTIYEDECLRKDMSSKAREIILSRFERGFVQQCQIDFYKEILE